MFASKCRPDNLVEVAEVVMTEEAVAIVVMIAGEGDVIELIVGCSLL